MATAAMLKTIPSKPILSEFTDSTALCRAPGEVLDTLHDFGFQLPPVVGSWGSSGSAVRLAFDPAREGRLPPLFGASRVVGGVLRDGEHRLRPWSNDGQVEPHGMHLD